MNDDFVSIKNETSYQDIDMTSCLIFQMLFVYCSCIFQLRITEGYQLLKENYDVIIELSWIFFKFGGYTILFILSIYTTLSVFSDDFDLNQLKLLKLLGGVAIIDYIDQNTHRIIIFRGEDRRWRVR